jgi:hypothetical protein
MNGEFGGRAPTPNFVPLEKMRGVMTYDIKRKWKVPEQRMDKSFWIQNNFLTSSVFSRE